MNLENTCVALVCVYQEGVQSSAYILQGIMTNLLHVIYLIET